MKKQIHFKEIIFVIIVITVLSWACFRTGVSEITIYYDQDSPQVQFAVDEITKSLEAENYIINSGRLEDAGDSQKETRIIIGDISEEAIIIDMESKGQSLSENPTEEGFCIKTNGKGSQKTLWVVGADQAGSMYGGLELAEQVLLYGLDGVKEMDRNPYMKMRGTKFNIPLDVRTPSYTDPCDAAQNNIIEMWSLEGLPG